MKSDPSAPTDNMPRPRNFSAAPAGMGDASGAMPSPAMNISGAAGQMPRPGGQMNTGAPKHDMPMPRTGGGASDDNGAPRFPPIGGGGGGGGGTPRFEPGVVEIQLREGVAPSVRPAKSRAPAAILSATNAPLDQLNETLRRHGLVRAESTFTLSQDEATTAQTRTRRQGVDAPHLGHFVTLHFPQEADTPKIAEELSALPEVERAVPVPIAIPPSWVMPSPTRDLDRGGVVSDETQAPPANPFLDPLLGASSQVVVDPATGLENQWYIFRCRVNDAWSRSTGANVVITDVDWGYRTSHQDLSAQIERTYNAFDGTADVTHGGSVSHGTGVAGLAGAAANSLGMAGVAFDAKLWAVQADSGTSASLGGNAWARGIDWVRTTDSGGRRKVIILEVQTGSFGNYEQVPSVNAAIRTAIAAGVVVCVAAGNGDRDAGLDDSGNAFTETGSILVGATAYNATQNVRASFSNWGPRITVCAPGDGSHDLTCNSTGDANYRNGFGGTSGATPKVAGVAALMLAANPSLTHAQIRSLLNSTGSAVVTDAGKPVGNFLDAAAAVSQASSGVGGRMEVFARGGDQALWHIWQTAPNNGWSGWSSLGGWIDLVQWGRNADGRLEIFARGADKAVWHIWQTAPNNGWSGWSSLGGWVDLIRVGQNEDGRLEVFARGADGAVWHRWQTAPNNGWSDWSSLGGWIDRLAIGRNADGRLEIFARGADGALWHKWQTAPNNGWSGWSSLGGWIDMLDVGNNADGRLEVFARGADGALWHIWQTAPNNGWSGWSSLGGWIDMLDVGKNADGRLEVFARGGDGALWHIWQKAPNSSWSAWATRGGWIDMLDVSQNADGRLEVFARGADKALWHIWQTAPNNGWGGWSSLGGWIDMLSVGRNAG